MQLRPLSDGFGVKVDGVDLASPLTNAAFKEVEHAFFAGFFEVDGEFVAIH